MSSLLSTSLSSFLLLLLSSLSMFLIMNELRQKRLQKEVGVPRRKAKACLNSTNNALQTPKIRSEFLKLMNVMLQTNANLFPFSDFLYEITKRFTRLFVFSVCLLYLTGISVYDHRYDKHYICIYFRTKRVVLACVGQSYIPLQPWRKSLHI